jgi:hypothetical protein
LKRTPGKALVPLAYERLGKSDVKYPFSIDWLLSDVSERATSTPACKEVKEKTGFRQ